MSISTYLTALDRDRDALAANLTTKGVTASSSETFTSLVPKVLDIPSGGSEVEWDTREIVGSSTATASNVKSYKSLIANIKELTIKDATASGYISSDILWPLNGNTISTYSNSLEKLHFEDCAFSHTDSASQSKGFVPSFIKEVSFKNCDFGSLTSTTIGILSQNSSAVLTSATFENCDFTGSNMYNNTFSGFKGTTLILDNNAVKGNPVVTEMYGMFRYDSNLTLLDISAFDFTQCTGNISYAFGSVPTNCTIYVKDAANQSWLTTKFSNYTFTVKP